MPKNKIRNKGLKQLKIKPKELVATFMYNIAMSFHKTEYYESQTEYKDSIVEIDKIKNGNIQKRAGNWDI